uniref:Uncharacterized protein n=1 Tax=Romanomermis culicivorax TaxID=13658 RepID=A0A915J1X0_ROMCU
MIPFDTGVLFFIGFIASMARSIVLERMELLADGIDWFPRHTWTNYVGLSGIGQPKRLCCPGADILAVAGADI